MNPVMPYTSNDGHVGPRRVSNVLWWSLAIVIGGAALELRVLAACDEFWLDEIWSFSLATTRSLWRIIVDTELDNNHILNTCIMHLLGPGQPHLVYRLPAVIAGTGAVLLAGRIASRPLTPFPSPSGGGGGGWCGLVAMLVFGFSFLLVQYSSEARGYGYVMFFALAAWELAQMGAERRSWLLDAAFWLTCILGVLAHTTFVFCYAGILAWSCGAKFPICRCEQVESLLPQKMWLLCRRHVPPLLFFTWLYFVFHRDMMVGGTADERPTSGILAIQTASLLLGGPKDGPIAWLLATVLAGLVGWQFIRLCRSGNSAWIFYLVTVLLAPAGVILATRPGFLYVRYYLVPALFILLLLSQSMPRLLRRRPWGKIALIVILAGYLAGNGWRIADLLAIGRGSYAEAVRFMQDYSTGDKVTVASRHDFGNSSVLAFYEDTHAGKPIVYFDRGKLPAGGAEWYLYDEYAHPPRAALEIADENKNQYRLAGVFPYSGLSGYHWLVYRNMKLD